MKKKLLPWAPWFVGAVLWLVCVVSAVRLLLGWSGDFLPVEDAAQSVQQTLAVQLAAGKAGPPLTGELEFGEPKLVSAEGLTFQIGEFTVQGTPHRYMVPLRRFPLRDGYFYDTRADGEFANVPMGKEYRTRVYGPWLTYRCWVFADRVYLEAEGLSRAAESLWMAAGLTVGFAIELVRRRARRARPHEGGESP